MQNCYFLISFRGTNEFELKIFESLIFNETKKKQEKY